MITEHILYDWGKYVTSLFKGDIILNAVWCINKLDSTSSCQDTAQHGWSGKMIFNLSEQKRCEWLLIF